MKNLGFLLVAASLAISSCAFLFDDGKQKITLKTDNGKKSSCRVINDAGSWNTIAPGTVTVTESTSKLKVYCLSKRTGYRGSKVVKAVNGEYPDVIVVKLSKIRKARKAEAVEQEENGGEEVADPSGYQPLYMLPEEPENGEAR